MNTDRRAVLSLIAMGRISPREAERLLAVVANEDDFILRAAVCFVAIWLLLPYLGEFLTGFAHVFPQVFRAAHYVVYWLGGLR